MTTKLGFFHQDYPYSQDVAVSPEMESIIGSKRLMIAVRDSHYDTEKRIEAYIDHNGKTYKVRSQNFMGNSYWFLFNQ